MDTSNIVRVSYWKPKDTNDRVCCITLENGYRAYGVYRSDKPVNKIEAKTQAFKAAMREVNGKKTASSNTCPKTFVYLTKGQIGFLDAMKVVCDKDNTFAVEELARIQFISPKNVRKELRALSELGIIKGLSIHKGIAHFECVASIENLD